MVVQVAPAIAKKTANTRGGNLDAQEGGLAGIKDAVLYHGSPRLDHGTVANLHGKQRQYRYYRMAP